MHFSGMDLSQVNTRVPASSAVQSRLSLTRANKIDARRLSTPLPVCDYVEVRER